MIKKQSHIRILLAALAMILTAAPTIYAVQPSAQSSLDKMIAALKKHPSITAVFTVWSNGNSSTGTMNLAGRNFHISTPEMKVWYDGKTQWSYAPSAGEVNITEPTAEELAQTNPFSILSGLNRNFTCRRLKAPAGSERIELVPKKKTADFESATITLKSSTSMPQEISIKDSKGKVTSVKISSITAGKSMPAGAFRFNKAAYPGVEIVDLR